MSCFCGFEDGILANVQQVTIEPLMRATIAIGTVVYTDEYDIYARVTQ